MIAMHEDASVSFNLVMELKDSRYRYWFTDFIVSPYERDRYANYVPVAGKNYPLEKGSTKLNEQDYKGYLTMVTANCRDVGTMLKSYMQFKAAPQKDKKKNAVVPKEW
ncbi:hypothetical protein [Mucilaginibacter antarcticus]